MKSTFKSGISLIAVLLFMLAATTASIVLFRWIGQENFSSGARLKGSEAYQASQAGLEAVRGWLANKGADAGALITTFETGGGQPVRLAIGADEEGVSLLGGDVFSSKQNFDVYLIGVNTSDKVYKLKFLSVGNARNSSMHSQVGIFDVEGLYKVSVSGPKSGYAMPPTLYSQGSVNMMGANTIASMCVNGDFSGNPTQIEDDIVVTGNLTLSGANMKIKDATCVGKNFNVQNTGSQFGNVYVGGDGTGIGTFKNLYAEGNLNGSPTDNTIIEEHLSVNGTITPWADAKYFWVKKNLVLGDNGALNFLNDRSSSDISNKYFKVDGDVWIPNEIGIKGDLSETNQNGRTLGGDGQKLEVKDLFTEDNIYYKQSSTNNTSNVTFKSNVNSSDVCDTPGGLTCPEPPIGAEKAKEDCFDVWDFKETCNGYGYVVEDIIEININEFETPQYIANGKCTDIPNTVFDMSDNNVDIISKLNSCYSNKGTAELYRDKYLVLKVSGNDRDYNTALSGNFIFIYEDQPTGGNFKLPRMTNTSSNALIYFKAGINNNNKILPGGGCNDFYNYFIYIFETNEGESTEIGGFETNCPLRGNVYIPRKKTNGLNCNYEVKINTNTKIVQNSNLLNSLNAANVIEATGVKCSVGDGGPAYLDPDATPTTGGTATIITDNSYVPAVPHLKVTLRSQYASEEVVSPDNNYKAAPAILVMPRVIYLTPNIAADTDTDLKDYYSVLYLNGATKPTSETEKPSYNCVGTCSNTDGTINKYKLIDNTYCPNATNSSNCEFYVMVGAPPGSTSTDFKEKLVCYDLKEKFVAPGGTILEPKTECRPSGTNPAITWDIKNSSGASVSATLALPSTAAGKYIVAASTSGCEGGENLTANCGVVTTADITCTMPPKAYAQIPQPLVLSCNVGDSPDNPRYEIPGFPPISSLPQAHNTYGTINSLKVNGTCNGIPLSADCSAFEVIDPCNSTLTSCDSQSSWSTICPSTIFPDGVLWNTEPDFCTAGCYYIENFNNVGANNIYYIGGVSQTGYQTSSGKTSHDGGYYIYATGNCGGYNNKNGVIVGTQPDCLHWHTAGCISTP